MHKLFYYSILLLVCLQVSGQIPVVENPYLKFDKFTSNEQLNNITVMALVQTGDGYLWIGTREGLFRYDGFTCKQFQTITDESTRPGSQLITCLAENHKLELMVGTANGLYIYNPQSESFQHLNIFNPENITSNKDFIRAIATDTSAIAWIETADGQLHSYNSSTGKIESFKHTPPSMIKTYFYHSIFLKEKGKIWLGGRYMGIIHFDLHTKTFETIPAKPNDPSSKRDNDIAFYFKDSEDVIWLGGIDGLYTLDTKTEIFSKKLAVSSFSMIEDNNNNLWVGTGNGIYILNKKTGILEHSIHDDNNPNSLINNHINKLFKDRAGNIWIGTLDGISIYRPSKNKFGHIYHIPGNRQTPVSNHISAVIVDEMDRIWIGTENQGIECFNANWEKLLSYNTSNAFPYNLASNRISTLMNDRDSDIWVGQWSGKGFNIINPESKKNKSWSLLKGEMKADWYNDFLQDKSGNYWMAVWGGQGLYRYNKSDEEIFPDRFASMMATNNQTINKVHFDGELIWVAFEYQNRLAAYNPHTNRYQFYSLDHYSGFDFNQIHDIGQQGTQIQFFTNTKTYLLDKSNNFEISSSSQKIKESPKQIPQIEGYKIYDYINDMAGNNWAATNRGLLQFQNNKPIKEYHPSTPEIKSDTLYSLSYEPPNKIWIGTAKGLCYFSISDKKFTAIQVADTAYLSSRLTRFLFEDSKGIIWIGTTDKGLMSYHPKTGQFSHFLDNPSDSSAFWGKEARCMYEDDKGRLWIGGTGLNQFHPQTRQFSHLTTANGLADNIIMAILGDETGNLWLSTNNGLIRYNPDDGGLYNFSERDGLQENHFSSAACMLPDGQMMFAGKNGINVINPNKIHHNPNSPAVVLRDFLIFDESHPQFLKEANSIQLNYKQNYFSFEFAALDFSDPMANTFAYQLENFDDNWVFTGADRPFARYTNVGPGKYIFRVKAANSDGIWNQKGFSIPIIISPPFWKTAWFYGLILLLFLALLFIYIKYREQKIKDENKLLVLEQKLLRSQMNPHFIFNSLSSIQSFIFENNPITAGSYLSRFAELIRAILYNSREEFISLEQELKTLNNYLSLQQLRYNHKFDFEIKVDEVIDAEEIQLPPMLAQPFIENAIEHGIKNISHKGFISIRFEIEESTLILIVEDNGIGIEAAKNLKNEKAKEHRSLATIITKERIEMLNKSIKNKPYIMKISEITGTNGEIKGTLVRFSMSVLQH